MLWHFLFHQLPSHPAFWIQIGKPNHYLSAHMWNLEYELIHNDYPKYGLHLGERHGNKPLLLRHLNPHPLWRSHCISDSTHRYHPSYPYCCNPVAIRLLPRSHFPPKYGRPFRLDMLPMAMEMQTDRCHPP